MILELEQACWSTAKQAIEVSALKAQVTVLTSFECLSHSAYQIMAYAFASRCSKTLVLALGLPLHLVSSPLLGQAN